jgi:hypothetical protein
MKRWLLALALLPAPAFAQWEHPRAMFTDAIIDRIEAKVDDGSADWVALKASCDSLVQTTAGTPDSLPPVYASREPRTYTPPGYIFADYQGSGYFYTGRGLMTCYYALNATDPTQAAKYKAQAKKVALAAAAPFASITTASPPAAWVSRNITSLPTWYITNTGGGGQARVFMTKHGLANGATITISGALGCTTANATVKMAEVTASTFDLVDLDGVTPIICNGAGTNYNHNFESDSVFPIRFIGTVVAQLYDAFYADFSAGEKAQLYATMNSYYDVFRYAQAAYTCRAISNYQAGYFNAAGQIGILSRTVSGGPTENPRGEEIYADWRNTYYELKEKPYFNRWFGAYGGFPEAITYQVLSTAGIAETLLAQWDANGEDLFTEFPWVLGLMKYWVHNTMPTRANLSYRGYITPPSPANTPSTPNRWLDVSDAFWTIHHIAAQKSDAFRPKFKRWIEDLEGNNGPLDMGVPKVLYWDEDLADEDWTTETPSLPQLTNPLGDYGRVTMRSDWTTSAVVGDIWSTPGLTDFGNGKERKDKGSILVQRGDARLLVSTVAEATRAGNTTAHGYFHDRSSANFLDEGFDQGIFYVQRFNSPFAAVIQNRAGTAAFKQPGWDDCYPSPVITSNPCRIDEYEDTGEYVYSRSVRLNEVYYSDITATTFFPLKGWDREILYVRPKVFVVYDRTRKTDRVTPTPILYTQHMSWNLGKAPATSVYADGFRSEVEDGGVYKGAVTHLLPAGMTQTTVNLNNYSLVYQMRMAPALAATEYNNWLTVVDAADAQANLEAIAVFATRQNIDVARLGDDTVVGFMNYQNGATPVFPATYTMSGMGATVMHYLCGLTASTTYKRTVSGNNVTIATSGGGDDTISTAAGCVEFESGAGTPDPDVVVTTATPMPGGTVGVAYSECLAATGGDGGPYTYALDSGTLPTGTSLSAGCITGTPSVANDFTFAIKASDGTLFSAAKTLVITIAANPPAITQTALPNGTDDVAYSTQVCATGGTTPYTFTVSVGSLPTGLSLVSGSPCATISGTPTTPGETNFTIQVEDDDSQTDSQAFSITIVSAQITLSLSVQAGSNAALVVFGGAGLPAGSECAIQLLDESAQLIQQNIETLRFAKQRTSFRGLSQLTNYGISASCPGASTPEVVSFTTAALVASDPVEIPIAVKPSALHPTVTQATLRWGISAVTENTDTITCASGCTFTPDLSADIYVYQVQYKNVGGTVLATTNTRELIVE